MAAVNVFEKLFTKIEVAIDTYIVATSADVINFITPIFNNILIIYLALWGIAHIRGSIQEPLKDGIAKFIKIVFVVALALNVGLYCGKIANFLYGAPEQISSVVTGASPSSAILDDLMSKGFELGKSAWDEGGVLSNTGMIFIALVVWAATILSVAYAGFLLLFSKLAMVVLLAIGPIFIVFILFPATQRFFEMWFGQVVNYGILMILAVALVDLLFAIFGSLLNGITSTTTAASAEIGIIDTIALVIAAVINFLILRQVPQIAMALGGGVALATQGLASAALNKMPLTSWMMATRPANMARSVRGVQRDFQTTKRALGAPGRAAGSLYRRRFGGNSVSGK